VKSKTLAHTAVHAACLAVLLLQGHRIQQLRQSERDHHEKALRVRRLYFECTKAACGNFCSETEARNNTYWEIVGPYPNW
jgi:hypothetical protein